MDKSNIEVAKIYIDKEGLCRVLFRKKIKTRLNLKSGEYLKIEIHADNKGFTATKIE